MSEDKTNAKNKIIVCYNGVILSLCLSIHPNMWVQVPAQVIFLVIFVLTYMFRSKAEDKSLLDNHMTYLIRTIWIGSLFFCIGFIPGCIWFWEAGEHSLMLDYVADMMGGAYLDPLVAQAAYEEMMKQYMAVNKDLLIKIGIITLGPSLAYMLYRMVKGLLRGAKGYRIMNVESWF